MGYQCEFNLTADDYGLDKNTRTEAQAKKMNNTLSMWMLHPSWSYEQIAEAVGISAITFARYRDNEVFMQMYEKACHKWFKTLQNKALESLIRKLDKDDFQAVKYTLDGSGYEPTQKVDLNATGDINIKIDD